MKIAVCFKVVPEFDQVVEEDWDNFSLSTDLAYVKRNFGSFDESALETALRLRTGWEELGEKTECTALTAGCLPASLSGTLFAVGFDRVLELSGGSLEFRPRHAAAVLGNHLSGYDLILTGRQAGYADTGMVPLLLAEILRIPVLTEVTEIVPCAGGIEVKRTSDTGRERLRTALPLLAVLGNSPVSALRVATLRARMTASKQSAEKPPLPPGAMNEPGSVEADGESRGGLRFGGKKQGRTCRFLPAGPGLAQSVDTLTAEFLTDFLVGRKTR